MTNPVKAILLGAAASLALVSGAAQAQQATLSEEEISSFFESMQQDTVEAVEAGDFERLLEWVENRIADEATFLVSNELYRGEDRKGFTVLSLDKDDMTRFGRMAVGTMSGMQGQPIQDYSLEIDVGEVTPLGPDAATVAVEYVESGTLSMRPGATGDDDETLHTGSVDAGEQGHAVQFEARAECNHVIRRGAAGDDLVVGLSNCQAETDIRPAG